MNRTALIVFTVAAGLVAVLAFLAINRDSSPEFGKGSYGQVTDAMGNEGLTICEEDTSGANVLGAFEGRTYNVTLTDCDTGELVPGHGLVVVDAYSSAGGLDKIDGDAYVGDSVLGYRWQQFLIGTVQSTAPDEMAAFRKAMDRLGAKQLYDKT